MNILPLPWLLLVNKDFCNLSELKLLTMFVSNVCLHSEAPCIPKMYYMSLHFGTRNDLQFVSEH